MIYLIISLILDIELSNLATTTYQDLNFIFPSLLIVSLPLAYLKSKNRKAIVVASIILGTLYDLLYSEIFLLNIYFFTMYICFIHLFYNLKKETYFNIIMLSFFGVIMYDIYIFFLLILLEYSNFKIDYLYYKIMHTIAFNLVYLIISIFILKSRIFRTKKRKIKSKKLMIKHSIF